VVKHKVGSPPEQLGVNTSMECDTFSFQFFNTVSWATSGQT